MSTVYLGNQSVVEAFKPDQGVNITKIKSRKELGNQITSMGLNETDIDDKPSRSMNLSMCIRMWNEHSDKAPAWVEGTDELLVALIADHFGCAIGRPKSWRNG